MSFFENSRNPVGLGGKIMVAMMNSGHAAMAGWGFEHITFPADAIVLSETLHCIRLEYMVEYYA